MLNKTKDITVVGDFTFEVIHFCYKQNKINPASDTASHTTFFKNWQLLLTTWFEEEWRNNINAWKTLQIQGLMNNEYYLGHCFATHFSETKEVLICHRRFPSDASCLMWKSVISFCIVVTSVKQLMLCPVMLSNHDFRDFINATCNRLFWKDYVLKILLKRRIWC